VQHVNAYMRVLRICNDFDLNSVVIEQGTKRGGGGATHECVGRSVFFCMYICVGVCICTRVYI